MFKVEKQDSITIFFLNASGFCQQWWLETSLFVVNLGYKIPRGWEHVVQYVEFVSPVLWQIKYYAKQTGSIFSCLIEAFISFLECMAKRHENNWTNTRSIDVKVKRLLWHCKMAWSFFPVEIIYQILEANGLTHYAAGHFYTSWKTSENQSFYNVFRRHRSGTLAWNWLRLEMKAQK